MPGVEPFVPAGAITGLAVAGQRVTLATRSGVNLDIRFPVDDTVRNLRAANLQPSFWTCPFIK